MKINASYPYPVLYMNNDDYVNSSFETRIGVEETFGEVKFSAKFDLSNVGMKRLIESGQCAYALHIECGRTSYRQVYESFKETMEVSIKDENLRGKVTIHSFVVAKVKIENYTNYQLNDWFKDIPITFEKGNMLAIGNAIEVTLFEDNMEMLNLPSIINITKSEKKEFMEVELNADFIMISLPAYEYDRYATNANSRLKNTIISAVILPSLVHVFTEMYQSNDYVDYTWYQVLEKIFADNNVSIHDVGSDTLPALKAAQMILRKPLKTSFNEIEKFNQMED
ncbi:hypothetical protein ACFFIS_06825 [Virgibacillus soli]|uniref:Uncharacterized protein n=1 Tax=Paracerasibacillus soli TaxID=480284 RepID=A0ABU5CMU9_9BACI|nr:hypothetical protein [Virgibacillus soli]MDY0407670.1 hypothetical protein [Virgibacillus soli]